MHRDHISEPSRYYHRERAIVVRSGLLLEDERWTLWHELAHSDAGDEHWHTDVSRERAVDREAARRAMPLRSLEWAFGLADDWHTAATLLKLPEGRVRWYVDDVLHPAARELVRRASTSRSAC